MVTIRDVPDVQFRLCSRSGQNVERRTPHIANMLCIFSFISLIIIIIFNYPQEVQIPGLKTKIKNKLEWLRVGIVLNWESFVKRD